jgi:integrase
VTQFTEKPLHYLRLCASELLIFTTSTGGLVSPRNFIRHFKEALKSAGLPDIRAYDLRHSHASLLLASRVNPKLVQERLARTYIRYLLFNVD